MNTIKSNLPTNKKILFEGTDSECCGNCTHMAYEDTDGFGFCNILATTVYCGACCKFCDPREPINE